MDEQLAVLDATVRTGLQGPNDGFTEGYINSYLPTWEKFQTFFEALLDRPITPETRIPEIETFGENKVRIIRCLWWLDRIGPDEAKKNPKLAGLFIRLLVGGTYQRLASEQEALFLLFTELDYEYATTVYSTGYHTPGSKSEATNAHNLRHKGIPAEYARELPWEDFNGAAGYSDEDIDALYRAKVPAGYAREFHDRILDHWNRVPHEARLIIDEMAAVIAFYHLGVPAGYAAACTKVGLYGAETIRHWQDGIAIEYVAVLA